MSARFEHLVRALKKKKKNNKNKSIHIDTHIYRERDMIHPVWPICEILLTHTGSLYFEQAIAHKCLNVALRVALLLSAWWKQSLKMFKLGTACCTVGVHMAENIQ